MDSIRNRGAGEELSRPALYMDMARLRDMYILRDGVRDREQRSRVDRLVRRLIDKIQGEPPDFVEWKDENGAWCGGWPSSVPSHEVVARWRLASFMSEQEFPELSRAHLVLGRTTSPRAGHHLYDKYTKRHDIAIFVSDRAPVSPVAWKEHVERRAPDIIASNYNTAVHEIVHMLDNQRYKGDEYRSVGTSSTVKKGKLGPIYGPAYHNHPVEVNAYLQEFFNNMEQTTRHKYGTTRAFLEKEHIRSERDFINWLQYKLAWALPDFYDQMRGDTYRRFIKRGLQLYSDMQQF